MSKVYFYSVSDILSEENDRRSSNSRPRSAAATAADRAGYCSRGEADHISVLDCETFHKEQQVRDSRNLNSENSRNLFDIHPTSLTTTLYFALAEGGRVRRGGGDLDAADGHSAAAFAAAVSP